MCNNLFENARLLKINFDQIAGTNTFVLNSRLPSYLNIRNNNSIHHSLHIYHHHPNPNFSTHLPNLHAPRKKTDTPHVYASSPPPPLRVDAGADIRFHPLTAAEPPLLPNQTATAIFSCIIWFKIAAERTPPLLLQRASPSPSLRPGGGVGSPHHLPNKRKPNVQRSADALHC